MVKPVWSGRKQKKSGNVQRNRSKSKGKVEVNCYQCCRKVHKKSDRKQYKADLERKNTGDKKKNNNENKAHNIFKNKHKEKANVISSVIIEEPSNVKDILCATMAADHVEVNDASN